MKYYNYNFPELMGMNSNVLFCPTKDIQFTMIENREIHQIFTLRLL